MTVEMPDDAKRRLRSALKLMGAAEIRIEEVKGEAATAPIRPDNQPTSPEAIAVAKLFGRKPDAVWSDVEIKLFKAARKRGAVTLESMEIMARYYAAERKKGTGEDGGMHRRDLLTWVRNVDGENDRAKEYASRRRSTGPGWVPTIVGSAPVLTTPALPKPTPEELEAMRRFNEERAERKRLQSL